MSRAIRIGLITAAVGLGAMIFAALRVGGPAPTPVRALTTIETAELQYYATHGRFAAALRELGPSGDGLIEQDLANGEKSGFQFDLTGTPAGYEIRATNGRKTYLADQNHGIQIQ